MVIAIDGPAGAGKSTIARLVAQRLGYIYIETGAMYRAVALLAMRQGVPLSDEARLEALAHAADLRFVHSPDGNRLLANGEDVTEAIRTPEVTEAASIVSTLAGVRRAMVERQREMARGGDVIMEGRDIGTRVFPEAEVKVFLDASPRVRSLRRLEQEQPEVLGTAEAPVLLERIEEQIRERDRRDRDRSESPLLQDPDALYLDSSALTAEQVVEAIVELAKNRGNG